LNSNLIITSVGFLLAGLGLAFSAFTFVSDLLIYIFPDLGKDTVSYLELGLFFAGLIGAIAGLIMEKSAKREAEV
jgi:hypothetical protein